jgi:Putative peptidoglycan binding domain
MAKTPRYRPLVALLAFAAAGYAHAGPFNGAVDGAFKGALIGDIVAGSGGAAVGAIAGGMIGASNKKPSKQDIYLAQKEAEAAERKAQWESEQRARQLKAQERQEAGSAQASGIDEMLLVETQRSLMRLGYDAGAIGFVGPELTTAVIRYQESKGLLPTGQLSGQLLEHMRNNGG